MKRLPILRLAALSTVSWSALNVGFSQDEFQSALFWAARSLGMVTRK